MNDNEAVSDYQHDHWEELYRTGQVADDIVSDFAKEVSRLLPARATIAELGCGRKMDAAYFAQQGYSVEALDFSEYAIAQNRKRYRDIANLTFRIADISQPLPFESNGVSAIYARLSLHYFTDRITKKIFQEIHRVLTPSGLLAFLCKTPHDHHYGQGKEIERDMFLKDGHIRHFFSEDYARACLGDGFYKEQIRSWVEQVHGKPTGLIKVIAWKK